MASRIPALLVLCLLLFVGCSAEAEPSTELDVPTFDEFMVELDRMALDIPVSTPIPTALERGCMEWIEDQTYTISGSLPRESRHE